MAYGCDDTHALISTTECAACGSGPLEPHLRVAGEAGDEGLIPTTRSYGTALADIVRCRACGHMQLERFPPEAELSLAYAEAESEDYVAEEEGQRATARVILDRVERHAPRRGALVDLGCWVGFFLDEARGRGWRTVGIEPSEFASTYARERLGLEVRRAELLEADLAPGSFDAAFMGDVLEHLADAEGALTHVRDLLTRGGIVVLALPDAGGRVARGLGRRWWSVIPTHVHYFTRHSLRTLLERTGYEVLSISTAPKAFTLRYYLSRLGGYRSGVASMLVRAADALGIADRIWAPDLRDRMLVVARRAEP